VADGQAPPRLPLRADIQALRALAVLLVVLNHAGVPFLPGGFLGVDIFFVISGYLMSGIIVDAADAGTFSYRQFYARRIRRLFPAAYATIIVTAAAAPFLLDRFEYAKFAQQLAGAFTFTVNVVLWRQIDYFDTGAGLKPLLHMWSLAVEEQYYLVLPFLTLLCPKRIRLVAAILLTAACLALCLYAVSRSPSAAFYLLPTRAWELGIGSVAALLVRRGLRLERLSSWWRPVCAAVLVIIPFMVTERGHPGAPAVAVCLATALLLISGQGSRPAGLLAPLLPIGDRSYSLYLVHWPLFAFANNVFLEAVPPWAKALLLVLCFGWMEAQYRLVERPLRHFTVNWRSSVILVAIPVIAIGASFAWTRIAPSPSAADRDWNTGLDDRCSYKAGYFRQAACESAPGAQVMLWGDSFGMHLGDGLAATTPGGIIQATRTVCGPFLDLAPINGAMYPEPWGQSCIGFNRAVLDDLARRPEVKVVVLSSALTQYVPQAEPIAWRALETNGSGFVTHEQDEQRVLAALKRTVDALHAIGKRVVLVAPPPSAEFNIGRCLDRLHTGIPTISAHPSCEIDKAAYERRRQPVLQFLAKVEQQGFAPVIRFDATLCQAAHCQTAHGDRSLYFDGVHFSRSGSRVVAERMGLGALVERTAR